jgi:hypothetical protein
MLDPELGPFEFLATLCTGNASAPDAAAIIDASLAAGADALPVFLAVADVAVHDF